MTSRSPKRIPDAYIKECFEKHGLSLNPQKNIHKTKHQISVYYTRPKYITDFQLPPILRSISKDLGINDRDELPFIRTFKKQVVFFYD